MPESLEEMKATLSHGQERWNEALISCGDDERMLKALVEKYREVEADGGVDHSECDCGIWCGDDRRCSCGNRRMYWEWQEKLGIWMAVAY